MKKLIIAVTGASGAGKTHFAAMLKKKIKDAQIIEINNIVNAHSVYSKRDKFGTKIVKLRELNRRLNTGIRNSEGKVVVVVGHLAPELNFHSDIAVIVRCNLATLVKRLEMRKYPKEKIKDNIISEAFDYCGLKIAEKVKESYEVESGKDKKIIIAYILYRLAGKKVRKPISMQLNKFKELLELINNGNRYGL